MSNSKIAAAAAATLAASALASLCTAGSASATGTNLYSYHGTNLSGTQTITSEAPSNFDSSGCITTLPSAKSASNQWSHTATFYRWDSTNQTWTYLDAVAPGASDNVLGDGTYAATAVCNSSTAPGSINHNELLGI